MANELINLVFRLARRPRFQTCSPATMMIFYHILNHNNKKHRCSWTSQKTLAMETGRTLKTVRDAVRSLVQAGVLSVWISPDGRKRRYYPHFWDLEDLYMNGGKPHRDALPWMFDQLFEAPVRSKGLTEGDQNRAGMLRVKEAGEGEGVQADSGDSSPMDEGKNFTATRSRIDPNQELNPELKPEENPEGVKQREPHGSKAEDELPLVLSGEEQGAFRRIFEDENASPWEIKDSPLLASMQAALMLRHLERKLHAMPPKRGVAWRVRTARMFLPIMERHGTQATLQVIHWAINLKNGYWRDQFTKAPDLGEMFPTRWPGLCRSFDKYEEKRLSGINEEEDAV